MQRNFGRYRRGRVCPVQSWVHSIFSFHILRHSWRDWVKLRGQIYRNQNAFEMSQSREELIAMLNAQTARMGWDELARHFARGVVISVAAELDLVAVAAAMALDDRPCVESWLQGGQLHNATDADAQAWQAANSVFWAVVVAPWVLVQECRV